MALTKADMAEKLGHILRRWLSEHPPKVVDPGTINRELLETLRALGYD